MKNTIIFVVFTFLCLSFTSILNAQCSPPSNLIPSTDWDANTNSYSDFWNPYPNGTTINNFVVPAISPNKVPKPIWVGVSMTGHNDNDKLDGGFISNDISIDPTKTYRYSVWVRKEFPQEHNGDANDNMIWFGPKDNSLSLADNENTTNETPYFFDQELPSPVTSNWYLCVGYVYGSEVTNYDFEDQLGVYDTKGNHYSSRNQKNYKHIVGQDLASISIFQRNQSVDGIELYIYDPKIEEVNGCEPSIQELVDLATGQDDCFTISLTPKHICSAYGGSIYPEITGGTPPFSYEWEGAVYHPERGYVCVFTPGTYGVLVTDALGCQNYASTTIEDYMGDIELHIVTTDPSCETCNDGIITATISNSTIPAPYEFKWKKVRTSLGTSTGTTSTRKNLTEGLYYVDVFSKDCDGGSIANATVRLKKSTDFTDVESSSPMEVSPNPFTDFLEVAINSSKYQKGQVRLMNIAGKVIYQEELDLVEGYNDITINTAKYQLFDGFYYLSLTDESGKIHTQKVMHVR